MPSSSRAKAPSYSWPYRSSNVPPCGRPICWATAAPAALSLPRHQCLHHRELKLPPTTSLIDSRVMCPHRGRPIYWATAAPAALSLPRHQCLHHRELMLPPTAGLIDQVMCPPVGGQFVGRRARMVVHLVRTLPGSQHETCSCTT